MALRKLLLQHQKFVKGMGVWVASVGAVLSGKDCLHRERRVRDPEAPPSLVLVKAQPPTLQERAKATNQLFVVRGLKPHKLYTFIAPTVPDPT
eukprot:1617102-Pyramimonas_sp.AAC.1